MSKVVVWGGSPDQIRPGLGRPAIKRPTRGSVRGRSLPTGLRLPNSSEMYMKTMRINSGLNTLPKICQSTYNILNIEL